MNKRGVLLRAVWLIGLVVVTSVHLTGAQIRVEDQRGRTIELPKPAERIVTIPMPMASMTMALDGGSRRIVGMHPSSHQSIQEGFLRRIFPEALSIQADVTRGGMFTPNLESILALRPDVVVQWTEPADLIRALEGAGLTVVGLINSPPTQEIHERNLAIVGEIIGQRERVAQLIRTQQEMRQRIEATVAGMAASEKPRVLYLRSVRHSMNPAGRNSYQDFWIRLTGGTNVADFVDTNTAVNLEQIMAWNPQTIFVGAFDDATPDDLMRHPSLAGVDAVRTRRVYKLPHGGYRWDPGSHESHLTWQWATMLLHPERARFDLRGSMRETYRFLYHYELTDADIDEILQMLLNASMTGYAAFAR
ncbi:MAG: ABC transporter substrate-binding protein [Candidatus Entotheonellia bacterium]